MAEFQCKLCCAARFRSMGALKMHISKALQDVRCPECGSKFEMFSKMIEHLEGDRCVMSVNNLALKVKGEVAVADTERKKKEGVIIDVDATLEDEEEEDDKTAFDQEVTEELGEYFCQQCDMHFDLIDEHIERFHEGQQVIWEPESDAAPEESNESSTSEKVYVIDTDQPLTEPSSSDTTVQKNQSLSDQRSPDQNIADKEGRVYTRKFVKIDKFWLNTVKGKSEAKPLPLPTVQRFTLRENELIQVNDETQGQEHNESNETFMTCPDCHSLYSSMETFQNHMCDGSHVKCGHCMKNFPTPEALTLHSVVHVKTLKNFICALCNTTFPTFKSLKLHKKMHEPMATDPLANVFLCVVCKKTVDNHLEEEHMATHQSDDLTCKICNRKLLNQSSLEMHMKIHANSTKKFACSYCKKTFNAFETLKDHLQNQCQKRMYACQYCGRRFGRPHEKVKHERIHTGEKPHKCDICGKAFRVSYCLTLHKRTHSGVRPYQCPQCGKSFKALGVFNHHMMTHSDIRAYKCPYCPKAFKTSVQLAGHKNCHTKPFKCTECNRPFSTLYGVRAHMESHSKLQNNLVYECWICGAQYSRAFALKEHMKQAHDGADVEKPADEDLDATESIEDIDATEGIILQEDEMIVGFQTDEIVEKEYTGERVI